MKNLKIFVLTLFALAMTISFLAAQNQIKITPRVMAKLVQEVEAGKINPLDSNHAIVTCDTTAKWGVPFNLQGYLPSGSTVGVSISIPSGAGTIHNVYRKDGSEVSAFTTMDLVKDKAIIYPLIQYSQNSFLVKSTNRKTKATFYTATIVLDTTDMTKNYGYFNAPALKILQEGYYDKGLIDPLVCPIN